MRGLLVLERFGQIRNAVSSSLLLGGKFLLKSLQLNLLILDRLRVVNAWPFEVFFDS